MTATLTFTLPDDQAALDDALGGAGRRRVTEDIDEWLRSKLKYGHDFQTAGEALEQAREELRRLTEELNE